MLADGWRITAIKFSYNKARKETRIRLVLAKGRKKRFMKIVNDSEFTEYVLHFKKFQDAYGNNEFIYVDDLKSYNKQIDELSQKGIVPKRPYKVFIGDNELKGVHLYHLISPGPGGPHVGAAHFFVSLKENSDFCQFDLRDEVKVIWTDNEEIAFRGFVHEASYSDDSAVFLCYGGSRRLHQGRVTAEFLGIKGEDALYFFASYAGYTAKFHGSLQPNLKKREFKVIFPIEGLKVSCDFKVENVLFTHDLKKELPNQAKNGKTLFKAPWSTTSTFAVVILEAHDYYEALVNAEKLAAIAVNWIQFRTDITIPCLIEKEKVRRIYYSLRKNFSRCRLIRYGLVIEQATGGSVFCLLDERAGHPLVFKYDPNEFLEPLAWIWNRLRQSADRQGVNIQNLYQALNWLMRSFETESPIDNLLQLWIALEFICSSEKVPKNVRKENIRICITSIKKISIPEDEKMLVLESIRDVNNPSLMQRWNHLINRLGVKLTEREKELVSKLRSERNKVTHGKGTVELSIEEVEKFRSILERVFLLKITHLLERLYGIPYLGDLFQIKTRT